ncbi:DNA-binding storekeeper protein-related transcriptional regulator [Abeliophyllum distichum]|uniref:DNA-binding storekeeper protein-related transcriptional regulator n=1 Tax=Abeliophyllum distichum TaxID=126358 RepID=A0ABD1UG21_9LAMI
MVKNSEPEKTPDSEPESGAEEDEASSEEIGSSDSDSEQEESQPQITQKPSTAPAPKKPNSYSSSKPQISSSEESESDSESDQPDPTVKPLASRPMDDPNETATRKLKFKPIASGPTSPTKSVAAKRPAIEKGSDTKSDTKDSKRPKKKPELNAKNSEKKLNDDSKKQLFQRLWSEEDEIVVLKGMIDYLAKKKTDHVADLNAFHDFIRKNLHVDVTRAQLQDKIRRLKKKYENNQGKDKKGKERTFTKSHDQKVYELSRKIWGSENGVDVEGEKVIVSPKANGSAVRKTPIKRAKVETGDSKDAKIVENANGDVEMVVGKSERFHCGNFEEWILRSGVELIEEEKRVEMEREWKKLRTEETALYLKKLDLMYTHTKLVLDVLKSSEP